MGKEEAKGTKGGTRKKAPRSSTDPYHAEGWRQRNRQVETTHTNGGKDSQKERKPLTLGEKRKKKLTFMACWVFIVELAFGWNFWVSLDVVYRLETVYVTLT